MSKTGEIIVIKLGGKAMDGGAEVNAFASEVRALSDAGYRVVVTHGWGPQATRMIEDHEPVEFSLEGLRKTSSWALGVILTISGEVRQRVVEAFGGVAVGIVGHHAGVFHVDRHPGDIGEVGVIRSVDTTAITAAWDANRIPVVTGLGVGEDKHPYNINGDTAAIKLAVALNADRLLLVTDVEGLYEDFDKKSTFISRITASEATALLPRLHKKIAPKVRACIDAAESGLRVHIVDGTMPGVLKRLIMNNEAIGTEVVGDTHEREMDSALAERAHGDVRNAESGLGAR
jgi:acetylglutamate kinase